MENYVYYLLESDGNRLAIMTCKRCGAAVILDSTKTAVKVHDEWHRLTLTT